MSGFLNSVQSVFGKLGSSLSNALDKIVPPEKRAEMVSKLQDFAINNPKLAAFLTTQIILTGFPLLLFVTFSITIFLFSLLVALLIGLLAAVLFTLFMVGIALLVVLPTIFMTTFTASFLFLWGLCGYYILKWCNDGDTPTPDGKSIGDRINNLTGGRMSWLNDGARKKQDDAHTGVDKTPKSYGSEDESANGTTNRTGKTPRKLNESPKDSTDDQGDTVQRRTKKNATGNAASTKKGGVSGAPGT